MSGLSEPFPLPSLIVLQVFRDLERVQLLTVSLGGQDHAVVQAELDQYGDLDLLPRPWDPSTCPPAIRGPLWLWLDEVAAWLNRGYAWSLDRVIPPCWPHHPHLAREIAVLACLRWSAAEAFTADPLEEWHRWALPSFVDRMQTQLGPSGCPPGKHTPSPAAGRRDDFTTEPRRLARRALFDEDVTGSTRAVR